MTTSNLNQVNQVLAHLQSGKSITSAEAMEQWDCYRLGAVIHSLRRAGHKIESVWEPNLKNRGMHTRYFYVNEE